MITQVKAAPLHNGGNKIAPNKIPAVVPNKVNNQAPLINKIEKGQLNLEDKNVKQILQKKVDDVAAKPEYQELRKELAKKLNDIDRIDKIIYDYDRLLKPKIQGAENQKIFENWMVGISYFLGSPYYNHDLIFHHLRSNPFFLSPEFQNAYKSFTASIVKHAAPLLHKAMNTAQKVNNIAILYPGSGGGGHKSPATAMAKNLEAKGYKVKLLDIDEFERKYDPKIGGLTRGEIFSKIYQLQGNPTLAAQMWDEGNEKQPLKDRRFMKDLTQTLRTFNTDHMFVVAHHQPEHTSLAYQLGIPATYVHTDNEFHVNLKDVALNQQELKKPLVRFSALSNNSDFYHYLNEHVGKHHYNELPEKLRKQMVRMNFPVRESFKQVSKSEKMKIRKNLGIAENATVVKVAMGANGIPSDIKLILEKIRIEASLSSKPLHVLVVCGSNAELKAELDKMLVQSDKLKFQVLGFLNEKEMSDFDKSSDIWVTKPGGSTSAEALAMKKQMLYMLNHHHEWELTNARALEKENLAEELHVYGSIMEQINRRVQIGEKVEYAKKNDEQWIEQIAKLVENKALPILAAA